MTTQAISHDTRIHLADRGEELARSREYCRVQTRSEARNFYYGLKLLPEPKRSAMYALYTYMRQLDDIVDDAGRGADEKVAALERWSRLTHCAVRGECPSVSEGQLWPAFCELAVGSRIPPDLFDSAIAGQRRDLESRPLRGFAELEQYCYCVAGVVGLASIHIWGFRGGASTEQLAIDRGIAFQLTNILRDLHADAGDGRVYIPADELAAAGVSPDDLRSGNATDAVAAMVGRQVERARSYYERSAALETRIDADAKPTLAAMTEIYRSLLEKVAADPRRALTRRVALTTFEKIRIAWGAARAK